MRKKRALKVNIDKSRVVARKDWCVNLVWVRGNWNVFREVQVLGICVGRIRIRWSRMLYERGESGKKVAGAIGRL